MDDFMNDGIYIDDEDFPKDLKWKIDGLTEAYFDDIKCDKYTIRFRPNRDVVFNFLFPFRTINIALDHNFILDNNIDIVFGIICKLIEKDVRKMWIKEDWEEY